MAYQVQEVASIRLIIAQIKAALDNIDTRLDALEAAGNVSTADIADGAVTYAKLASDAKTADWA